MSELYEERQPCDNCKEETKKEAMRYFSGDTHLCNFCIYPNLKNYVKLLEFVRNLTEPYYYSPDELPEKAEKLLKEIGELND